MTELWTILSAAFRETPPWVSAVLLGWVLSWGATQALKFIIPMKWSVDIRREAAQLIAFMSAFVAVVALRPLPLPGTVILATVVGLWSPISFALLMAFLRKRWPHLADILTQDVRGVLFGERVE